jgi:hypothetical protein
MDNAYTRATLGTRQGTKTNKAKTQHRNLKLCVTRTIYIWFTFLCHLVYLILSGRQKGVNLDF